MNELIIIFAKYLFVPVVLGAAYVGYTQKGTARTRFVVTALATVGFSLILTKIAAAVYFDPRPFTEGVVPLITHVADNGFPSDHTVLSVAAAALIYTTNPTISRVLFGLALIVGICRVLSGIHHPIDVFAGALIGLSSVLLAQLLVRKLPTSQRSQ